MPVIPKQKSAFWALAAAGGVWAWQNRNKLRSYVEQSGMLSQNSSASHRRVSEPEIVAPVTGETRRIGDMDMSGEFTNEKRTGYDPAI